MENLTGRFPASLVPTSQSAGNMIQPDLATSAMTAPGSEPTDPLPPPAEGTHPEPGVVGPTIPVSNAPHKPAAQKVTWPPGFTTPPATGLWKKAPG